MWTSVRDYLPNYDERAMMKCCDNVPPGAKKAFIKVYGNKDSKIEVIGAGAGEKRHEDYISDVKLSTVNELVSILKEIE